MALLKGLALLVIVIFLFFENANTNTEVNQNQESVIPLRTHSIYVPYVDQDLQNRWFDFGADTVINTNKHIRLTQDRQSQVGWLWSRL
ncbi:5960_t:CDS:2, partial [Acaulospora morrowiae]